MTEALKIPGELSIRVFEASRIKDISFIQKQNAYVKIKHNGKKDRTLATTGGTAPRWNEEQKNVLKMEVDDIRTEVSVEVWNEAKSRPNKRIDSVNIPVEPYALAAEPGTPRWHKLSQGSLLFSVDFQPSPTAKDAFHALDKASIKRAADPTAVNHSRKFHSSDDKDGICYGDEIALHALGERYMKFGSCLRTHLQKSKHCLQLTKTFNDESKFRIEGSEHGEPLKFGDHFQLYEVRNNNKVMVGTGMFKFVNVNPKAIERDTVEFGDGVYLEAIYAKTGAHALGAEGESLHVVDPTIYISPHTAKATFTITYGDGLLKAPSNPPPKELDIQFTTYNVWMMPDKITTFANVSPHKNERAQLIPSALPESDIVVFNEAFCHVARPVLLEAMKERGYYYESPVVGHLVGKVQAKFLDGGVVVLSKHPIEETDVMRFGGVCQGDDSLADKGVVYACINKEGRRVHCFASHTQAWTTEAAVKCRQDQFRMMRNFIDEKEIPSNEPVIVAGDFNVNKLLNGENGEYDKMVELLECDTPDEEVPMAASFDADNNPLAADGPSSDGVCERLDFILTCQHHLKPTKASAKVNPIHSKVAWTWEKKGEFKDLSDHYPVTAKLSFSFDE